ncbi:MAG: prepilin-type N-terminal cleavage/methylation domain-containing protein [Gammaproteobacteria bacterium]
MNKQSGFTLVELLVVLAIIAILMAIMVPGLLSSLARAKQKRAMAEIHGMAIACNSYSTDQNKFPIGNADWTDTDLVIQVGELAPYYIHALPNPDPWLNKYQYASTEKGEHFGLRCLGLDGLPDSGDLASLIGTPPVRTQCFENDIVWLDGAYLHIPEGKQRKCK